MPGSLLAAAPGLDVRFSPASPRQGDVAIVLVGASSGAREVAGSLGDRALHFFPHGDGHATETYRHFAIDSTVFLACTGAHPMRRLTG